MLNNGDIFFVDFQITVRFNKEMQPLVGKYLSACFSGLKDRNNIVRKYNATAIGHLVGIAKVWLLLNVFSYILRFNRNHFFFPIRINQ